MGRNRNSSAHEKQVRFLTILVGALMIILVIGALILINRPVGGFGVH